MTTAPASGSPRHQGDAVLAWLAWSVVAVTAALEAYLLIRTVSIEEVHGFDRVAYYSSSVSIAAVWVWLLSMECRDRYHPARRRKARRMEWTMQGLFLVVLAAGAEQVRSFGSLLGALLLVAMSQAVWMSWMATLKLHADDQKVVDEVIAEEERIFAGLLKEQADQRRKDKLQDALASVRMFTSPAVASAAAAEEPLLIWNLPTGRHDPVVYFLRNGDRMKIGTTTDIRNRVRRLALRAENVTLMTPGDRVLERELHRRFAAHRVGTTEWFAYEGALADYVTTEINHIRKEQTK